MRTRHIYIASLLVSLAAFVFIMLRFDQIPDQVPMQTGFDGTVNRTDLKSVKSATFGVWFAALLTFVLWVSVPKAPFAYRRMPVPDSSDIPFSQTAADKTARFLASQDRALAWMALAVAVSSAFLQITMSLPAFRVPEGVGIVVFIVAIGAAMVNLFRSMLQWQNVLAEMPTDEDEVEREKHFGYGSAMGVYKEPNDPMVMQISPFNNANVEMNWAHKPVRQRTFLMLAAFVVVFVAVFI